jgi:hypothetical protein
MVFAIKAAVTDLEADAFRFDAQKTMYDGKRIAEGAEIFIFASETQGGPGLLATGVVTAAEALSRVDRAARQTPRVNIAIRRTANATRALGRRELRSFVDWGDGRAETELNFKLYRQATNKIVAISDATAAFLRGYF